jgi:protein-S-isoprenylcysteine O-methyltransferase Ste14
MTHGPAEKSAFVRIGDFFFKWRNFVFPLVLLAFLVLFRPADSLFGSRALDAVRDLLAIGVILAGLGVRFATIGWAYIVRGGKGKKVYAEGLVTDGYFGMCRNPLYVGNLLIAVGTAFLHGHPVVTLVGTVVFIYVYVAIVAAEEFFLRGKFGAAYDAYCAEVPRWLPRLSRHADVTKGMSFSLRRSIYADFPTIFNVLIAIMVVQNVQAYTTSAWADYRPVLNGSLAALAVLSVLAVVLAVMKRRDRRTG